MRFVQVGKQSAKKRLKRCCVALLVIVGLSAGLYGQGGEETHLRSLAGRYFELFGKKDVAALQQMWNAKSPAFEAVQKSWQKIFAETAGLQVKAISAGKVEVDGETARVVVTVEISALELKSGKPAKGFGRRNRVLQFRRAGREWQVWRELSGEEELMEKLAASQSEAERKAIVERHADLQTAELVSSILTYGRQRFDQGLSDEAMSLYQLASQIAETIADGSGKSYAARLIGVYHYRQGRREEGVGFYKESLRLAQAAGNREMEARALNSLGVDRQQRGELQEALEYFRQVKAIAEELQDETLLLAVLNNSAIVHTDQIKYKEAVNELLQALGLVRKIGSPNQLVSTLLNIASANRLLGNHNEALEYLKEAHELAEKVDFKLGIGLSLQFFGDVYHEMGNLTTALEYYLQAKEISEGAGGPTLNANLLTRLGNIQTGLGNSAQALEYFKKALKIASELDDKILVGVNLGNMIRSHLQEGDYARALEYSHKVLAIAEQVGDPDGKVIALGQIGFIYQSQLNYPQAQSYYERGLEIAEKGASTFQRINLYLYLGYLWTDLESYAKALQYFGNALRLCKETNHNEQTITTLLYLGMAHNNQGNPAKALENYQEALKISEASQFKTSISPILNGLGRAYYQQGEYSKALDYARRSSAIARQENNSGQLWQSELLVGQAYRALNNNDLALQAFSESVEMIEKMRDQAIGGEQDRQRFFEKRSQPYGEIIELLQAQKRPGEALAYAERFKGRVLLDTLQSGRVNVSRAMSAQEQEKERRFQSELISLNTRISRENQKEKSDEALLKNLNLQLQKTRQEYEDFQFTLYAAHPELKTQRGQMQPLTLSDASALLPDAGSALLEFVVRDDNLLLFVITRKQGLQNPPPQQTSLQANQLELQVYPLQVKRKELQSLTRSFVNAISYRSAGYKASAATLYNRLLKPAQAQLRNVRSLVIVPDDVLWELPFQALQSSPNRFLVQDYAISYAPSLTVLREMSRKTKSKERSASATLLALGNPDIGKEAKRRAEIVEMGGRLEPLPEAERQVKALAELYGTGQSKTYIGTEAREERVKEEAGRYRILHLATHGILNDASPMYSHLVLSQSSGGREEDGLLEAWEILRLELNAEMVVLSACDTARGKVSAGEGVIGLSWSMFVAGCPSVVVSQWKVESSSTTELMLEFHRRLKSGEKAMNALSGKSQALRQASLKLLRSPEYRHPFYWAGFIVVGDNSWH